MQYELIHPCLCFCASFHPGSFLDSSSALLAVAACTALGEIARNGPLLIPAEGEGLTKLSVVENLLARIPSGKESTKVTQAKRKCSLCHFTLIEKKLLLFISIYFVYHIFSIKDEWFISSSSQCCLILTVCLSVRGPDEGAINPNVGLPPCGRCRLPSSEEAAAGSHGLCRGKQPIGSQQS